LTKHPPKLFSRQLAVTGNRVCVDSASASENSPEDKNFQQNYAWGLQRNTFKISQSISMKGKGNPNQIFRPNSHKKTVSAYAIAQSMRK
jgi:hypothetical protein